MQDHYKMLGVNPRDNAETIRAAYRRLVRELHPDLSGCAVDHEQFGKVAEAYRILSDNNLRRTYDAKRLVLIMLPVRGLAEAIEDPLTRMRLANKIAGGLHRLSKSARAGAAIDGRDMVSPQEIDFSESYTGTTRTIRYRRPVRCTTCAGTGRAEVASCDTCMGRGVIAFGGLPGLSKRCPHCDGRGLTGTGDCPACDGQGQTEAPTEVTVKIPAGITDGRKLKLTGKGEQGRFGGKDGDLLIPLQVDGSLHYHRDGNMLKMEITVPLATAVGGGKTDIRLPDDTRLRLSIPKQLHMGKPVRVSGRGFADPQSGKRGDLLLTVDVALPTDLNSRERQIAMDWLHCARKGSTPPELAKKIRDILSGGN